MKSTSTDYNTKVTLLLSNEDELMKRYESKAILVQRYALLLNKLNAGIVVDEAKLDKMLMLLKIT